MTLPRTRSDRSRRPSAAPANGRKRRGVLAPMPEIFVAVKSPYVPKYAKARIRIRKGCYQYLVWRDGDETREFYLGKKENHAPHHGAAAPSCSDRRRRGISPGLRGTK